MDVATHIEALRLEGGRLADAAALVTADEPVPTCPEWALRDLVRHTGGVHRWATGVVATPHTELWAVELDEVVGTWPSDEDLVEWFRAGHADLVAALSAAPPDLECWTFLRAPSPLAHWARRQAHETAMHRVDAELTAGVALSPIDAALATDGVDELLCAFAPRRSTRLRADQPTTLQVQSTDTDAVWTLRIDAEGVSESRDADGDAATAGAHECVASGSAEDLFLALWNRGGRETIKVEGDPSVLAHFLDSVQVRWA